MADLLLELFSEEIPARMQNDAAIHLEKALITSLFDAGYGDPTIAAKKQVFVTPRRLAVWLPDLPAVQPDISQELKGPKVGAPEGAMAGFLKKTGLTQAQLEQRDGVYFAKIEQKGRATSDLLKEIIEKILAEFPWPKSMRWGSGETSWVRPLHSILCIFDGKVVPLEFAGVKAGNITRGHRFLAPAEIVITDAKHYESALENAKVIADREKRKAAIAKQLEDKCKALGSALHADAGLLEEVTGLVEWPVVLSGKIDASYMDLPEEVLILEMKNHQKYFATREPSLTGRGQGEGPHPNLLPKGEGALSPYFLITSNMVTKDAGKAIVAGNERVLRARFADGRFFYDQDRKTTLEDWGKKLGDVTYHAKLGTVADKVERIVRLGSCVMNHLYPHDEKLMTHDVARAVQLSKADLTTGMVGEFPELQGVMGRYYALAQGEKTEVADAIRDHYKPQGPGDFVPTAPVSICVALADKLDTLISMFAIGEKPTGSKDPFALRRAALGVIRIVLENNLRLPLLPLFQNAPLRAIATHKAQEKLARQTEEKLSHPDKVGKYFTVNETACSDIPEDAAAKISAELLAFFHDRLIVQLKDQGLRYDVIKAVVANGDDDLLRIVSRAKALQDFLATEDGKNLLAGYKRAANILSIEEKKDKTSYDADELDTNKLSQYEETTLGLKLMATHSSQDKLLYEEQYAAAMLTLAELRPLIDVFFEKIMVNCEDKELRINRLRLLASIRDIMDSIADFSKIEG